MEYTPINPLKEEEITTVSGKTLSLNLKNVSTLEDSLFEILLYLTTDEGLNECVSTILMQLGDITKRLVKSVVGYCNPFQYMRLDVTQRAEAYRQACIIQDFCRTLKEGLTRGEDSPLDPHDV